MFKEIIVLVLAAVGCHADAPAPTQGFVCGKMPGNIISCSQIPSLFGLTHVVQCKAVVTPNVPASKLVKSAECEEARQYAQSCPICPNDCFAPQVPNDSCHACLALPRSA